MAKCIACGRKGRHFTGRICPEDTASGVKKLKSTSHRKVFVGDENKENYERELEKVRSDPNNTHVQVHLKDDKDTNKKVRTIYYVHHEIKRGDTGDGKKGN